MKSKTIAACAALVRRTRRPMARKGTTGRGVANWLALPLAAVTLVACSGAEMSSYDAEKSRIRNGLPSEFACEETDIQVTCKGYDEHAVAYVGKGTGHLQVQLYFRPGSSDDRRARDIIGKLASEYGLGAEDLQRCTDEQHFGEEQRTFRTSCVGDSSGLLNIVIDEVRRV